MSLQIVVDKLALKPHPVQLFFLMLRKRGGWYAPNHDTMCFYGSMEFNDMIITVDHEFLHRVIFKFVGLEASLMLDNLKELILWLYEELLK